MSVKIKDAILKIIYKIYVNYLSRFFRFSSKPYISGDSFRNFCNHIFDENKKINPKKVNFGDYIFVKTDLFVEFFSLYHPKIENEYYLITHNSDLNVGNDELKYIDDKIIHLFSQNLVSNFKDNVSLIPIGIENRWRLKNGKLNNFKKNSLSREKTIPIFSCFSSETNNIRNSIVYETTQNPLVEHYNQLTNKIYLDKLSRSMFCICPEGNGVDTHRIWESYIMESIPIVVLNSFTSQLKSMNFPMLYLEKWDDINNYNLMDLKKIFLEITDLNQLKKLSSYDYWINYIKNTV